MCDTATSKTPEQGYLDTLPITVELPSSEASEKLKKKGIRKAIAHEQAKRLLEINTPLVWQYKRTLECGSYMKLMSDGTTKSFYCGKRWCPVCSSHKQGDMINAYQKPVSELEEPYFVTLTMPAVKAPVLAETIKGMPTTFRQIKDSLRKQGVRLKGIRKIECNYNPDKQTYNPHYHMIVDGEIEARALYHYWMKHNPEAVHEAQDIQPADSNTLRELVKYTSKTIVGKKFYPHATDNINRALSGVRTFQAYGGIRRADTGHKKASEAPEIEHPDNTTTSTEEPLQKQNIEVVGQYYWWGNGWFNSEGIPLVEIEYTDNMQKLLSNIRQAPLIWWCQHE